MIRRPPDSPPFPYPTLFRSDQVGADVGRLGVDAAAEPREDGDQRPAEGEPDQVLGRLLLVLVEPLREDPVVGSHAEEAEADRSEEHTSELQSRQYLVCRLLL